MDSGLLMSDFAESYVGRLRSKVGHQLLHIPGARIVIESSKGQILLQKRSDFGIWGLPGGSAEHGESLVDVIEREVMEETGIQILEAIPFGFASNPQFETITFPNGDQTHFHVLNFHCTKYEGVPTPDYDESLDLEWFNLSQLPDLLPNMKRSIHAFKSFRETGQFQLF